MRRLLFWGLLMTGCGPLPLATSYLQVWTISEQSRAGEILLVVDGGSPSLDLPPNTLPSDVTTVTLQLGLNNFQGDFPDAGPVLIWGPPTALNGPATLVFNYDAEQLHAPDVLALEYGFEDGGHGLNPFPPAPLDGGSLATVSILALGAYAPVACPSTICGRDSGSSDSGEDGGTADGGSPDSGEDGGTADAGFPDSGEDGGTADAGSPDGGGAFDGGPSDAGKVCRTNADCDVDAGQQCVNGTCQ
jgi:hypothetical protein